MISRNPSIYLTNKWVVVTISAIILGYVAAAIDLVQVSLNDLKKGICLSKQDSWTLLNPYSSCPAEDWYGWDKFFFNVDNWVSRLFINFPIYFLFAVGFALLAGYLTYNRVYLIRQSGIPEIKLIISGFNLNINEYLSIKTLSYKIVALILVVSSGLWLGKEGPLVHVSCCIFNIIYDVVAQRKNNKNEAIRRELLSAATATGISVAFNSPIGGVLFVLESMPSYFIPTKIMWNSFVSATIAVIALTGFKVFTDGRNFNEQDLFQVNFGNFSWLFMEVIPFIILGALGGMFGHFFIKLNSKFSKIQFRKQVRNYLSDLVKVDHKYGSILEILVVVIITTLLNFPLEIAKLPLNAYLNLLFKDCPKEVTANSTTNATTFFCQQSNGVTLIKLLYILVQGFLLTSYTFGVDLPGGILMPSLVLGATTGRSLGIVSQALQSKFNWESLATCTEKSCLVSPSSYAVIGAASFMTGITKLSMCVVVIMFEITGAVSYVLPIMCGVMTSKFVSDWLCPNNIYDTWLQNNFNQKDDDFQANRVLTNQGKGTGLISFSNSTSTIKTKLPDISIKSLMIPLRQVKVLCLVPENEPYTLSNLTSFVNDDSHEGYPMIINHTNPVYLGYITKSSLISKLSNLEDPNLPICFQVVSNLPTSAISMQLHYERKLQHFNHLDIELTQTSLKINEGTPALLIIEAFEKLNLNNLVIFKTENIMSGFIDRFILAKVINDKFSDLINDELDDFETINDLENNAGDLNRLIELDDLRINRKSIELIT
ncbi:CLCN5 H(+)/Cl(-) exchange transporter 5 [Candida maltosa Xu316]|uniref:Chloride channel protein n=1 Tax=Candida maltosa (strain Xu316) TaxID=1245528 RepID=M3IU72_CANMX|nr:hypothetical protein G210_4854 [Candida maltosa Xu316]